MTEECTTPPHARTATAATGDLWQSLYQDLHHIRASCRACSLQFEVIAFLSLNFLVAFSGLQLASKATHIITGSN